MEIAPNIAYSFYDLLLDHAGSAYFASIRKQDFYLSSFHLILWLEITRGERGRNLYFIVACLQIHSDLQELVL